MRVSLDLAGYPGRCPACEWHVRTQGHHDDCPNPQARRRL